MRTAILQVKLEVFFQLPLHPVLDIEQRLQVRVDSGESFVVHCSFVRLILEQVFVLVPFAADFALVG